MIDREKVAAAREYLEEEFHGAIIEDRYDLGRMAQSFLVKSDLFCKTVIISEEFLSDHPSKQIPEILRSFLLAEHLREYDRPIIVTNSGLGSEE